MRYLLDTNILSETRKPHPDERLLAWLDGVDQKDLFVSVLTLGELAKGIAKMRRRDPRAADSLERWRLGILELFDDRLIPVDSEIATLWGELSVDRSRPAIDTLLAATAKARGLAFVTRNTKDMAGTGVKLVDPIHPKAGLNISKRQRTT